MNAIIKAPWFPIAMLVVSNVFMTFAWYGHLRYKDRPLHWVILASWGIAFFEYVLMVPANRWGHATLSAAELKIIQEIITLLVFAGFAIFYLKERMQWNHLAAFVCIVAAAIFTFWPRK